MILRGLRRSLIPVLCLMGLASIAGLGQSTSGSITGTVKDGTGAPIADANVSITNATNNLLRQTRSSNSGVFTVTQLPPGKYNISVEKIGFKKLEKT